MSETERNSEAAMPDQELWEGPWRLSEDDLRIHAGARLFDDLSEDSESEK